MAIVTVAACLMILSGCSLVDENLAECGESLSVDYQLRLVTNIQTELETTLSLEADLKIATELKEHFSSVFTDFAHDVDLSFYDSKGDMPVLEHMSRIMDANQTSYTLFLPVREYMHTSVANIAGNSSVTLEGAANCKSAKLVQHTGEDGKVIPHDTGLFTARTSMDVEEGISQSFQVSLYMANCATALIIDPADVAGVKDVRVELQGFADSFDIADSTYHFDSDPRIKTNLLPLEKTGEYCFTSVNFPSQDYRPETKVVIETVDPFLSKHAPWTLWRWFVYVTMDDGTVTLSELGVSQPLRAGQLKVVKGTMRGKGEVFVKDPYVGVSVILDWNQGHIYEPKL